MQGFDPKVITGGVSGYLRQEFRELELLDEITKLKYKELLPDHIKGDQRNSIIDQFRKWKGKSYVPKNIHHAISWKATEQLNQCTVQPSPWQLIKPRNKNQKEDIKNLNFVPAKGTIPIIITHKNSTVNVLQNKKRKLEQIVISSSMVKKRRKISTIESNEPKGFIWDAQNWSCAYDSLFTILLAIWNEDPSSWKKRFKSINKTLQILSLGFKRSNNNTRDLETVRNTIRHLLHQDNPKYFLMVKLALP
jgi:hypothetical protein